VNDKDFPIHRTETDVAILERGRRANGEDVPRSTGPGVALAWSEALIRDAERNGSVGNGRHIGALLRMVGRLAVMCEENAWLRRRLEADTRQIEDQARIDAEIERIAGGDE